MCANKQLLLGQQSTWHANGSGRGCQRSVGLLAPHDENLCAPTKLHCGLLASQTNATTRNACEACRATRNFLAHQSCPEMLPPACHLMFIYHSSGKDKPCLGHASPRTTIHMSFASCMATQPFDAIFAPLDPCMDTMEQRWHCLQYQTLFLFISPPCR